jgi:hypothetical protein
LEHQQVRHYPATGKESGHGATVRASVSKIEKTTLTRKLKKQKRYETQETKHLHV